MLCLKRNCKIPIISPGLILFLKSFFGGLIYTGELGVNFKTALIIRESFAIENLKIFVQGPGMESH